MNVNTALVLASGQKIAELSELEQLYLAEADSDPGYQFRPTLIKVPTGGASEFVQSTSTETLPSPLEGIILGVIEQWAFYPIPFGEGGSKIPLCASIGGKVGNFNLGYQEDEYEAAANASHVHPAIALLEQGQEIVPSTYRCSSCGLKAFGTAFQKGKKSVGSACKPKLRILFLPKGWRSPAIVVAPLMSVGPVTDYLSGLRSQTGRGPHAFWTALHLVKDKSSGNIDYSKIQPKLIGPIEEIDVARAAILLRQEFESLLGRVSVSEVEDDDFTDLGDGRIVDEDGVIIG